jgi:hypothetical protein
MATRDDRREIFPPMQYRPHSETLEKACRNLHDPAMTGVISGMLAAAGGAARERRPPSSRTAGGALS